MIADSSSLIIFAKINKLNILIKLFNKIQITKEIYNEIIEQGILIHAPDAEILKNFFNNKKIEIIELNKNYEEIAKKLRKTYFQLGIGEAEAIALSLQEKNKSLVIDERIGRNIAKLYDLKPIGSLRILLEAYKKKIINEKELRSSLDEMIKNKFRIGAEIINEFWKVFEKLKKEK
ncbi:DUF3368 domain-containing protein [Candidatus Pacearchaeota archaeon]|nr:DUF3368 domain-containing protein [Candidatus Pacearchaeota archaeon]